MLFNTNAHAYIIYIQTTCIGNALINNNMANVMFAGLNCNEKYTIIAGGMLDGNLVGPKSSEGTIFMLACDSILELVERIFHKTKDGKN